MVSIPSSVTEVEGGAFSGCIKLQKLTIPAFVTKIGNYTFDGCQSLKVIVFEDGATTLKLGDSDKGGLFSDCPLDSIYLGRNVTFTSCNSYSSGKSSLNPFDQGKGNNDILHSAYVSDFVTDLPLKLFYCCKNLEYLYGMRNVKTIDDYVFAYTNIKKGVIGNNVSSIGRDVFSNCVSMTEAYIGDSIQELNGNMLFYGCTNLKKLYIGKGIKKIGRQGLCDESFSDSGPLANAKIFIFSNELTYNYKYDYENRKFRGIPLDVAAIYVVNPDNYQTLLGTEYNLKPMLSFKDSSLEYTGRTPDLSYTNNLTDFEVNLEKETTPYETGSYNTNIDVTFCNENYSATVQIPCSYTITKASLKIIAENAQKGYGEDNPELHLIYLGFKNGETQDVLRQAATVYTTATKESNVGTYPIYCSGAEARNYDIIYQEGVLTINKAEQEITWNQEFTNAFVGDTIELTATSTSGLPVKYRSTDLSTVLVSSKNGKQYAFIIRFGVAVLTAYQNGDINHYEANEINKIINAETNSIRSVASENENISETYYDISGKNISKSKGLRILKKGSSVIKFVKK